MAKREKATGGNEERAKLRFRKIAVRMWGDEKFQRLSKPQPCAQTLFVYLLTCPNSTSVPGLFKAGRAQLAEDLEWSLEGFDKAFREICEEGLVKADWRAKVVWIPGSQKYNPPENPNVVKGWRHPIDLVPECALKAEALRSLRTLCERLGKGFREAFDQHCAKSIGNQEPESEPESEPEERDARGRATPPPDPIKEPSPSAAPPPQDPLASAPFPESELERPPVPRYVLLGKVWNQANGADMGAPSGFIPSYELTYSILDDRAKRRGVTDLEVFRGAAERYVAARRAAKKPINLHFFCKDFTQWCDAEGTGGVSARGQAAPSPLYRELPIPKIESSPAPPEARALLARKGNAS